MGKETGTTENTFAFPSQTEIDAWKAKHGRVHKISVKDKKGNEYLAVVRHPKFNDMQVASASESKKKMTYNLSIWNNCKLAVDPAIEADDYLLLGALGQINDLVEYADASTKEL